MKLTQGSCSFLRTTVEGEAHTPGSGVFRLLPEPRAACEASEDLVAQLDSPATESGQGDNERGDNERGDSGRGDSGPPRAARGSRLARRRRVLLGTGIAAALLAVGGLIGASFVKSPQQLAANTPAPPATVTTATVVSQVLTSSVQMRGTVYPATQYDVYATAGSSSSSPGASSSTSGSTSALYSS